MKGKILTRLMARFGWMPTKWHKYDVRCFERDLDEKDRIIQAQEHAIRRLEKQHEVTMEAICSQISLLPANPMIVRATSKGKSGPADKR